MAILLFAAVSAPARGADFYVSPSGKDSNPGTQAAPFATLEKARDAVRKVPKSGATTVWLAGGTHLRTEPFVLQSEDSGGENAPVTYRAVKGASPVLSLGRAIPTASLRPVTAPGILSRIDPAAKGAIRQVDLKAIGSPGSPVFPAHFSGNGGIFEVFQKGERLPVSRWPNGVAKYAKIKQVLAGGSTSDKPPKGGIFEYSGDRPARWVPALQSGVWLSGFWRVPWICEAIRVESIDPSEKTITFAAPVSGGIGSKYSKKTLPDGTRCGNGEEKWFALNLLEEIDEPGEWCVDFSNQILYIWPAADPGKFPLLLADVKEPILSAKDASNVRFIGLTLDGGADDGIRIEGGKNVQVAGCKIRNAARRGVVIIDGFRHQVLSCDISHTGLNAISLRGGDRLKLTPCGHRITNNEIFRIGRYLPTAAVILGQGDSMIGGGVGVNCVGTVFSHNRIHHVPNAGVYYTGNDNLLELNEVFRIGQDSGDLGGFYSSGGWTSRGNTVRHNFVHDSAAANAFYVDDGDSGDVITGNVACRVMSGILVGGGHDHALTGNIFVDCPKGGIRIDARGLSRNYTMSDSRLGNDFRSVKADQPPWSNRFPELLRLLTSDPRIPSGISVTDNVLVRCGISIPRDPNEAKGIKVGKNFLTKSDPGFADPSRLNFSLKPDSPVFKALPGFRPIPFEKIGLFTDEFRASLPSAQAEPDDAQTEAPAFDSAEDIDASNKKP